MEFCGAYSVGNVIDWDGAKMKPITLPRWLSAKPKHTERANGAKPEDIVLWFALVIRLHDSARAVRALARRLEDRVPFESQARMRKIRKEPDDAKVLQAALTIINNSTDAMGILVGQKMRLNADMIEYDTEQKLVSGDHVAITDAPPDSACQVTEEITEGWGWPFAAGNTTKAHYFLNGKALCGRWSMATSIIYASRRSQCVVCARAWIKISAQT